MSARKWNGMQSTAVLARHTNKHGAAPAEWVWTVSPGVGPLWTAPLRFAQPPRRGTLCWGDGGPNMRVTSGQDGDAHGQDDGNGGYVGGPTCVEGESEGSGMFLISNRGGKQNGWAVRY